MPQKYFKVTGKCERCPRPATSQIDTATTSVKVCHLCAKAWWSEFHAKVLP